MSDTLSELQAYRAMYEFLVIQNKIMKSEDIEYLLGGMTLIETENGSMESIMKIFWRQWQEAIIKSKENPEGSDFKIVG